jgi:hypothetical protein
MMTRPFRLDVPQARLDWISRRVGDAVIGYAPDDDADWKYGTDAHYLAEFRDHWRDCYDWRAAQDAFNALPQFTAEIEGIAVHFYHLAASGGTSGQSKGYPIILSHGWPGSVLEYLEAMPLLAARGFDVVVPSLPGYGFSGRRWAMSASARKAATGAHRSPLPSPSNTAMSSHRFTSTTLPIGPAARCRRAKPNGSRPRANG